MYNKTLLDEIVKGQPQALIDQRLKSFEAFDSLPMPTWKRIRLKDFNLPTYDTYDKAYIQTDCEAIQGVTCIPIHERSDGEVWSIPESEEDRRYGLDEKLRSMVEAFYNAGVFIRVGKGRVMDKPIGVSYQLDADNQIVLDQNIIIAERNSEITLIIDYSTVEDAHAFHNGVTKVLAMDNAKVKIIKIQRMNDVSYHFDSNVAFVGRDARVEWVTVELGSHLGATSYITNLDGDHSESDIKSIYFGDGKRQLDLGFTMNHRGKRSNSHIESRGALKDRAKKVFRGNLDFKKGAKRAKGEEAEYVLLLDPTVKSDAIPALLCGEDDVEGEHAASAGQISDNQLYYLMSRGLTEQEAKKVIVEASFRPIIDQIPVEALRECVQAEIHSKLMDR